LLLGSFLLNKAVQLIIGLAGAIYGRAVNVWPNVILTLGFISLMVVVKAPLSVRKCSALREHRAITHRFIGIYYQGAVIFSDRNSSGRI
jgi:hypothetical protein